MAYQLPVRPQNLRAWREQQHSFTALEAFRDDTVTLSDQDAASTRQPAEVEAASATPGLFSLIGVAPILGHTFVQGQRRTLVLSNELYRSRFNQDPRILGKTILVSHEPYTVIGVLPGGQAFPSAWGGEGDEKKPLLWMPLEINPGDKDDGRTSLRVFGRLRDGVAMDQARAEMKTIEARLKKTPFEEGGFGINLQTLRQANTDQDLRLAALVLQAGVGFVLLITCANAGNLLLGRAVSRDKEIAVRTALGASGWQLFQQTLTESMFLSAMAATLALPLAWAALKLMDATAPADETVFHALTLDGNVLTVNLLAAALLGILLSLLPAWQTRKADVTETLNRSTRGVAGGSRRLRALLVVGEIALSLVLMVGAGLMMRSLSALLSADLGFRLDHLLVMRLAPDPKVYNTPEKVAAFDSRLLDTARSLNGVETVGLTTALPLKSVSQSSFEIPGRPADKDKLPVTDWARVSDGYFETLRLPLLQGRSFSRNDVTQPDPAVAVVNKAFQAKFFPNSPILGQQVKFANEKGDNVTYRIVGVVADEHQMGPDNELSPELYLPGQQFAQFLLVARTKADPSRRANALKQLVWNIDKHQAVEQVMTEDDALSEWLAPRKFILAALGAFAGIALTLAGLGLYSVLAYTVALRNREIGIRVAIGAEPKQVAGLIMREGLLLALIGITIGLAAAFTLTRFMQSLIAGISQSDPAAFAMGAVAFLFVAGAATYLPALRAAKIDPVEALRRE